MFSRSSVGVVPHAAVFFMYFGGRSCDLHILLLCHLQPPSKIIFFEKIHMFPKMWIKKEDSLGFSKFLRWKNHFQIFYMSNFCS